MDAISSIALLGLGLSGEAVLRWALVRGLKVYAWDDRKETRESIQSRFDIVCTELTPDLLNVADVLVSAPGISDTHPVLKLAQSQGQEVICDIELWHRFYPDVQTIGITGTNGKSTVCAMVHHILQVTGQQAYLGGNIGKAVFDLPLPDDDGKTWYVLELSSFQIERCPHFRPSIAALLNITPDHLDRHHTMDRYAGIKASLFEGAGMGVILQSDAWCQQISQMVEVSGVRRLYRLPVELGADVYQLNETAAVQIAVLAGVQAGDAQSALQSYEALPHRQNRVGDIGSVTFINDSKATNAPATKAALCRFAPIYWIVGGVAKAGGLDGLQDDLKSVQAAYVIGEDRSDITGWLDRYGVPYVESQYMPAAIEQAYRDAEAKGGGVVLLSPACASYDQYANFMARGDDFVQSFQRLKNEVSGR